MPCHLYQHGDIPVTAALQDLKEHQLLFRRWSQCRKKSETGHYKGLNASTAKSFTKGAINYLVSYTHKKHTDDWWELLEPSAPSPLTHAYALSLAPTTRSSHLPALSMRLKQFFTCYIAV